MSITKRQLEINNKILKTVSMYLEKYKLYLEINELKSKLNEDYKMLEGYTNVSTLCAFLNN